MTTQADLVQSLELLLDNLSSKDRGFAESLVKQGKTYVLSGPQVKWVHILRDRAMGKIAAPEVKQVGSMAGLVALFQKAKQHLKFPKLFLEVEAVPVVVSLAGAKSKAPGSINVAGEGDFATRPWYGRVSEDGSWTKGMKQYKEQGAVEKLLNALSRNPATAAKAYGKLTGRCCFCNLPLSDVKSTAAGFGPTCAKNWGLEAEWKKSTSVLKKVAQAELEIA